MHATWGLKKNSAMGNDNFLNSTGQHKHFLNSTGRHHSFLYSTYDIRTPVKGPHLPLPWSPNVSPSIYTMRPPAYIQCFPRQYTMFPPDFIYNASPRLYTCIYNVSTHLDDVGRCPGVGHVQAQRQVKQIRAYCHVSRGVVRRAHRHTPRATPRPRRRRRAARRRLPRAGRARRGRGEGRAARCVEGCAAVGRGQFQGRPGAGRGTSASSRVENHPRRSAAGAQERMSLSEHRDHGHRDATSLKERRRDVKLDAIATEETSLISRH